MGRIPEMLQHVLDRLDFMGAILPLQPGDIRLSLSDLAIPIIVGALSAAGATVVTVSKIEATLEIRFAQQSKEIAELKMEVREHRTESQALRERVLRHEVEDEMRNGKEK